MKFLLILALLTTPISAQTVTITQDTANKCAKCFEETDAWKAAALKAEKEALVSAEARKNLEKLIDFYAATIDSNNQEIIELRKSIRELMEFIIKRPTKKCNGLFVFGC